MYYILISNDTGKQMRVWNLSKGH